MAGELWATNKTCSRQGMGLGFFRGVSSVMEHGIIVAAGKLASVSRWWELSLILRVANANLIVVGFIEDFVPQTQSLFQMSKGVQLEKDSRSWTQILEWFLLLDCCQSRDWAFKNDA
jgi:hypothetical protein